MSRQQDVNVAGILACRQAIAASRGQVWVPQPVKRAPCPYCRAQEYSPCVVKGTTERMDGYHPARYVKAGVKQPVMDRPQPDPQLVDNAQYDQDGVPIPNAPPEDTEREWYP